MRFFVWLIIFLFLPRALPAQNVDSLKQALAKTQYPEQRAHLLKKLGWLYRNINLKSSLEYSHQALELAKKTHDRKLEAEVTRMIGVVYMHFLFHSEGLEWGQRALLLSQEINYEEGVAFCYDNFGVTYYYQKVYGRSEEYFDNALKIFKKLQHTEGLSYVYTHLSWVYRETNRLDLAIEVGQKALREREKLKDNRLYANTLRDLAQVYEKKGDIKQAFQYMWQAIALMNRVAGKPFIDEHYQVMANFCYKHKPDSAEHYAHLAYQYAHERGDKRQKVLIYEIFQKIYENKKDYRKAFEYQTLHYKYQDSVYNENIDRNNASLEAKFEYQQKEKLLIAEQKRKEAEAKLQIQHQQWIIYTILLGALFLGAVFVVVYRNWLEKKSLNEKLDEQNQELATQAEALHESNIFKDKLFSIISHDLRAPLAQVQSVLELLVNELLDLEEFREILPNLLQNTKTTMSFLDNLLLWAKSQIQGQNMDKQYFNITDLIQKNIALFQQGAINKNILLAGSYQSYQVFADKNMIDLVVRNLLNNAIKFCQEGDKIMVHSLPDENMLKVCVEDTGVGISSEILNKLLNKQVFSQRGTSGEAGTGLGLKLCQDFVEKNGGKMWIESELGKGSKFFFSVQMSSIPQEKATS
jgi:signal transduction histidine kinase/tetratricopeptide (TPR) repeat protein